jgi:hypothetical protein
MRDIGIGLSEGRLLRGGWAYSGSSTMNGSIAGGGLLGAQGFYWVDFGGAGGWDC